MQYVMLRHRSRYQRLMVQLTLTRLTSARGAGGRTALNFPAGAATGTRGRLSAAVAVIKRRSDGAPPGQLLVKPLPFFGFILFVFKQT